MKKEYKTLFDEGNKYKLDYSHMSWSIKSRKREKGSSAKKKGERRKFRRSREPFAETQRQGHKPRGTRGWGGSEMSSRERLHIAGRRDTGLGGIQDVI